VVARLRALRLKLRRQVPAASAESWAELRDRLDNERISMILAFTLAPDSNCVDVGCHEGSVLSEMVRLAPGGSHMAFEPIPEMCAALHERFPDVVVRPVALSNQPGEADFKHVIDLPGYSGLRERTYPKEVNIETIRVRTERLDDTVSPGWAPSLIKIDVEGAEQLVIEGALKTICIFKPTVIFEHGPGAAEHYGTSPAAMHRLLHDEAGLRIFDLDGGGPYCRAAFEEEFGKGERWQWVAHR
jgi:FkbM family methyltransferase